VGKPVQHQAEPVNPVLNSLLNILRQFEETGQALGNGSDR
jgi:hypothetical protein